MLQKTMNQNSNDQSYKSTKRALIQKGGTCKFHSLSSAQCNYKTWTECRERLFGVWKVNMLLQIRRTDQNSKHHQSSGEALLFSSRRPSPLNHSNPGVVNPFS